MRVVLAVLIVVLTILAALTACVHTPNWPSQPRNPQMQQATVLGLEVFCEDASATGDGATLSILSGTGVIIDPRHVLTAQHMVECPAIVKVLAHTQDGAAYTFWVEREWPKLDLARLVIATAEVMPFPPAKIAPVYRSTKICVVSANPHRRFSCGELEAFVNAKDDWGRRMNIRYSAETIPGNSGSPVYDEQGNLIGINTHHNHGITLADHPEVLR